MRIGHGRSAEIGLNVGVFVVEPARIEVLVHPVFIAHVVGDDVHNHLKSFAFHFAAELDVFFVAAKSRIDFIIVCDGVPMETLFGLIVRLNGVEPQCGDSQFFEVVQLRFHTCEVAAMPRLQSPTIHFYAVLHVFIVVVVLAITKPIGENEVGDIVRRKSGCLLLFDAFGFELVV